MAASALITGLSYALCVLSGISVLLSAVMGILVVMHRHMTKDSTLKYIRHGSLLTVLANVVASVGVTLVMLWNGTNDRLFCEAGGFLFLFGVLESVWMLLVCGTCLMIHTKTRLLGRNPLAKLRERWNVPIFLLSVLLKAVVLAMLVFLALTKTRFFSGAPDGCSVLLTFSAESWEYSAVLVVIGWLAIVPATVISLCNVFATGSLANPLCRKRKYAGPRATFGRWMAICHLVGSLLWIIVLMMSTVIVFSGDGLIDSSYVNIALGYIVTLAVTIGTMVAIVVLVLSRRWRLCDLASGGEEEALMYAEPPDSLVSMSKMPNQKDDIKRYLVHWFGLERSLVSGVMKVYQPASINRWRSEVNAVAKVTTANHPNLARYLWQTSKNTFAPEICTFTGDLLSPECSVICMQHYPHGTLSGYLKTRSHMTEVGLYKVTLDVARGLGFIHQHHLVHNALTTETIYMSSLAGKIGVRAVIGDFENSYEVSENTLRKSPLTLDRSHILDTCSLGSLYSISQQLDMDNNKFAPDIRSFGMVVLEMLMALGEFDEHSEIGIHYRSADSRRNSAYDNASVVSADSPQQQQQQPPAARKKLQHQKQREQQQQVMLTQQSAGKRQLMGSDTNLPRRRTECNCSPRVTDIRAVKCRSLDGTPIQVSAGPEKGKVQDSCSRDGPGGGNSAFTSVRSGQESVHISRQAAGAVSSACPAPVKPKTDIQARNLPPLPPKNIKSPRRYRSTNHKSTYNVTNHETISSASANQALSDMEESLSVAVDETIDMQSNNAYGLSPTSDQDFYSLSVGSFGSFETIYEDEERPGAKSQLNTSLNRPGRPLASKPPVLKRKMADGELQKRRLSIASANDSVFSMDSGIGSYSSDTYSEMSGQLYGSQRTWSDASRSPATRTESPDVGSVLLHVRKKPCSKHHPPPARHAHRPHHHTSSSCTDPSTEAAASFSDRDGNHSSSCQTDSPNSNTDTMSSEEPAYEVIASLKRAPAAAGPRLETRVQELGPKMVEIGGRVGAGDPLGVHPAIRQQYRYAVPRLGVSAVLARRLSDASLSSLTSCSTHRSQDVSESREAGRSTRRSRSRPGSATRIVPSAGGSPAQQQDDAPLSSSVLSIIQDSKMLLEDQSAESGARLAPNAVVDSCKPRGQPRSRNAEKKRRAVPDHASISRLLDSAKLDPKEKGRLLNMLKLINGNDKLGIIGKQMMTLFSDCWLEDPVPSADELFQRLNLVLPSAAV